MNGNHFSDIDTSEALFYRKRAHLPSSLILYMNRFVYLEMCKRPSGLWMKPLMMLVLEQESVTV